MIKAWAWYAIVQLISLMATIVGLVLLIPFCLAKAWTVRGEEGSVDEWSWRPLNFVYGNPEDGVSGLYATIWINGTTRAPYMPNTWAPWRAYCWSALRNSCDNLKYVFAWKNGPYAEYVFLGRTWKFGWQLENGLKVPVF